jgi:UDP-N-acetylmuramate dehydrogenase
MGGAAVSDHHALALVNRGTTSTEILSLAKRIEDEVHSRFGVTLEREPVIL